MLNPAKFVVAGFSALMLLIIFTASQAAFAQTYTFHQRTGAAIVPGTVDTGNHCQDCVTDITLPFTYTLYGVTYTTAKLSDNGTLQFTSGNNNSAHLPLPRDDFSDTIFLYWKDLDTTDTGAGQGVFTSVSGPVGDQVFTIEWRASLFGGVPAAITEDFEVRLFESSQRFDIIYGAITSTGESSTVGVQHENTVTNPTPDFTQYEFNNAGTLFPGLQLIANTSPTAADSTISGRITSSDGAPVSGAVINLSGTQSRRTITDSNGNYRFDSVESSGFYTITPSRANYNFSPFNRSFSQVGSHSEAAFTAASTGDLRNPLDTPEYFVRQQYLDGLGREPDELGFNYWSDQILACGSDASCTRSRRIGVAAAFFIEPEGQQTSSFIYDLYAGALARQPLYGEYSNDRPQVVGGANLDAAKTSFAQQFVGRAEFVSKYQQANTAASFVDALLGNVQSSGVDLTGERANLIGLYNLGTDMVASRAAVVRSVADNTTFRQSQYNRAFVLTEYFAFLRRDIDQGGYNFWVNVLGNGEAGNYRGMVCSFVTSREYQLRFSSVITHDNTECGQ